MCHTLKKYNQLPHTMPRSRRRAAFALKPDAEDDGPDVDALIDAFRTALACDVIRDVASASASTTEAFESLLLLTADATPTTVKTSRDGAQDAQYDAFGGNLPDDVRDLIFARLSARDAAMLACTCREFRALVGTWRRNAKNLDLPRANSPVRANADVGMYYASRVGSMMRAYPNVQRVSFKKLAKALKPPVEADGDDEDNSRALVAILMAISANNASHSVEAIDFDGCGEWLSEFDVVHVVEICVEGFPHLSSLAWPRARRLTGKGLSRMLTLCGDFIRELRLPGCVSLDEDAIKLALDAARGVRVLDVTGCSGLKQLRLDAHEGARLEIIKAVNCTTMTTCIIRRTAGSNALRTINVADCAALRTLQVQSNSVETLNAAGCRAMETFNCFAPQCETLLLNRCAAFRAMTDEINTVRTKLTSIRTLTLDSCKSLTSSGFDDLLRMCASTLEELSAEGCFSIDRAVITAPNLVKCTFSGSFALQNVRVSSTKCASFVARACKDLTEVRFERGAPALDAFDVRNSNNLRRVIGVRDRRLKRKDITGCPASIEFIENYFS